MLDLLGWMGRFCVQLVAGVGEVFLLLRRVLRALRRGWPDRRVLIPQFFYIGIESVPVVLITGGFTGMVLAYNAYFQLEVMDMTSWTGPLVSESLIKQLGPVLAGLMLAGRVGGAMAAELGTMTVTEQVDALETMGVDPVRYLVAPRVLACAVMTPILTGVATFIGIGAGYLVAVKLGGEPHFLWANIKSFSAPYDFAQGLIKALVFGVGIALICCHKGITTRGGAEGVGISTTQANVSSCIFVLISNMVLTMILMVWE